MQHRVLYHAWSSQAGVEGTSQKLQGRGMEGILGRGSSNGGCVMLCAEVCVCVFVAWVDRGPRDPTASGHRFERRMLGKNQSPSATRRLRQDADLCICFKNMLVIPQTWSLPPSLLCLLPLSRLSYQGGRR